jgi:hypothetical protein
MLVGCDSSAIAPKNEGKAMHITVERSGGFTGIPLTKILDSASLPPQEATNLQQMMTAADFFALPSTIPSTPQPDRFQYRITVEQEGRRHSVTVGETAVPAGMKPLLNWLMTQPAQPAND